MKTMILDGLEELPELMASIEEDILQINYVPLLQDELMRLADLEKSYFDSSTGPDGAAWLTNAPSTIRQKGHNTILRGREGMRTTNVKASKRRPAVKFSRSKWIAGFRLATSLTAKTTQSFGDSIREAIQESPEVAYLNFGTAVEYSNFNEFGTDRIPARPHKGINERYMTGMVERACDFSIQQLAKA